MLKPIDPKVIAHLDEVEKNRKYYADLLSKDWSFIKRYAKADSLVPPPAPGEKRVVFMGNSITDAWINADPSFFWGNHIMIVA